MDRIPIKSGKKKFFHVSAKTGRLCFIKELKWGKGKRCYLTDEPNADLEPCVLLYFQNQYKWLIVIVDKDENVYNAKIVKRIYSWMYNTHKIRIPKVKCSLHDSRFDIICVPKKSNITLAKSDLEHIRKEAKRFCKKL